MGVRCQWQAICSQSDLRSELHGRLALSPHFPEVWAGLGTCPQTGLQADWLQAEAFDNRQSSLHPNTASIVVLHHRNASRKPRSDFHCRHADRLSFSFRHHRARPFLIAQRVPESRSHINTTKARILVFARQHVFQLWKHGRREEDRHTVW